MAEEVKNNTWAIGVKARRRDEHSVEPMPGKLWSAYKSAFSCTISKIFIVSALCFLFCAPAVAWVVVYNTLFVSQVGSSFMYSLFDGLGYASPDVLAYGFNTASILGTFRYYEYALVQYAVLIPCIALGGVGIGGLVYVSRMSVNRDAGKVVKTFFRGIKYTWLSSLVGGLLVGAGIFLVIFCAYVFDAYMLALGGKIVTMIFSIILLVLLSIYAFYLVTLSADYEMPFGARLKDALLLTFKRMPSNLLSAVFASIFIGLAFLLILLFGNSTFGALFWFLLFFLGFYAIVSVFVVFDRASFDKIITAELLERENRARTEEAYAAIRAAKAAGVERNKKTNQPSKFVNPKKRRKQDGKEESEEKQKPAPKPQPVKGYSKAELKKLEEDKQRVLSEEKPEEPVSGLEDLSVYEDDED